MWDLPGPGLEPVSPALARGFLTTVPPGKPSTLLSESLSPDNLLSLPGATTVFQGTGESEDRRENHRRVAI